MKRLLLLASLLCIAFMSLSAQSLEETMDWIESKIEDSSLTFEKNYTLESFDPNSGAFVILKSSRESDDYDRYEVNLYSLDPNVTVHDQSGSFQVFAYGLSGSRITYYFPNRYAEGGESSKTKAALTFDFHSKQIAERVANALKHAIETINSRPIDTEGEIF